MADTTEKEQHEVRGSASPRVLFTLGFRPFFLAAGVSAAVVLALWVAQYTTLISFRTYYDDVNWHGHEMVFGYTVAVIAGFLLTAVRNWTNLETLRGTPLALLVGLWVAARILPLCPEVLPGWLIALVDIAFLPILTTALAVPLIRSRQVRNLVFIPLLGIMTGSNILVHLEVLGATDATARMGTNLAVYLTILLITIIGGRVVPFFTKGALPGATPERRTTVEWLCIGATAAFAATSPFFPNTPWVGALAALAAVAHAARLWGWYDSRLWTVHLLWVLYLGYAWLVIGFSLSALAAAQLVSPLLALHAFTAGAIGILTLGMMSRVALGHTGRPLQPSRAIVLAFVMINLAAATRVLLPILAPQLYIILIGISGSLWVAAFVLFLVVYTPIVIKPRVDLSPEA